MESSTRRELPPRVSTDQLASGEFVKRMLKLRWMGMVSEAETLNGALVTSLQGAPRREVAATEVATNTYTLATRKAKTEANIARLVAAFPPAFSIEPKQIRPLGIGIKQKIYARCNLSHREVGAALRCYTGRVAYLHTIVAGAIRVDLDGNACGTVTAKEATYAAEQIRKILGKAAAAPKDKIKLTAPAPRTFPQPPAIQDASKSGPRRLGLADLKRAAIARRTAASGITADV